MPYQIGVTIRAMVAAEQVPDARHRAQLPDQRSGHFAAVTQRNPEVNRNRRYLALDRTGRNGEQRDPEVIILSSLAGGFRGPLSAAAW